MVFGISGVYVDVVIVRVDGVGVVVCGDVDVGLGDCGSDVVVGCGECDVVCGDVVVVGGGVGVAIVVGVEWLLSLLVLLMLLVLVV